MKNLIILTLLLIACHHANAQGDIEGISNTLMDYIEGSTEGQPERLKKAFHPDLNLYYVRNDVVFGGIFG